MNLNLNTTKRKNLASIAGQQQETTKQIKQFQVRQNSANKKDGTIFKPKISCQNCKELQQKFDALENQFQIVTQEKVDASIASNWVHNLKELKKNLSKKLQCQSEQQLQKKKLNIIEILTPENVTKEMDKEIKQFSDLINSTRSLQNTGENQNQYELLNNIVNLNSELERSLNNILDMKRQNKEEWQHFKKLLETLKSLANELPKHQIDTRGTPEKPSFIRIGGFDVSQFLWNTHLVYQQYFNQTDENIKHALYKAQTRLVQNIFQNLMLQQQQASLSNHKKCPCCSDLVQQNQKLVYLPCHIYHESCFINEAKKQQNQKQKYFRCYADQKIIHPSVFLQLENQNEGQVLCVEYFKVHS